MAPALRGLCSLVRMVEILKYVIILILIVSNGLSAEAIVATIKTENPNQQTAWQRFMPTGPWRCYRSIIRGTCITVQLFGLSNRRQLRD